MIDITGQSGNTVADDEIFTQQLAELYNKANYDKDRVLEMRYTDIGRSYQIILTKDGADVCADVGGFVKAGTVIETPYALWKSISEGEISGSAALAEGKYRVSGDFTLMMKWDSLFGGDTAGTGETPASVSDFAKRAARVNSVNIAGAAMGAAFLISSADGRFFAGLELVFALFWGVTVFLKVPVTCYFSASSYDGGSSAGREKILKNPIFIRTNRILTACWAALYLIMAAAFAVCRLYDVPM